MTFTIAPSYSEQQQMSEQLRVYQFKNRNRTDVRSTTAVGMWLSTAPTSATVRPAYVGSVLLFTRGAVPPSPKFIVLYAPTEPTASAIGGNRF